MTILSENYPICSIKVIENLKLEKIDY